MTKYFVWVSGLRGPAAQIWYDMATDGNGKAKPTLTKPIPLPDDDKRELEELKKAYPYEG